MSLSLRLVVLVLCLVLWVIAIAPRLAYGPKFSQDSAAYIDCARSVSEGRGFMTRPYGGLTHNLWEPMNLFPPGYSLLMVPLIKYGVSPAVAATDVAIIFSAICVVLLGNLYLTRLPTLLALSTLGAAVLMPSFLRISGMAWSEAPFLVLSLISLLCMMNWSEKTKNLWAWILTAGVFGGLAWCVRNVAVALLGTSCLFLAVHLLWRPFRFVAKAIALWLLGWGIASSWLIYYNLNTFWKIIPYSLPPSELSLRDNIKGTSIVLFGDMSGSDKFGRIMTNKYIFFGLLCFVLLALILWIRKCTLEKVIGLAEKYRIEFLIAVYVTFIIVITIVARTTYEWGETINSRHYFQIYWAIWLLISTFCFGVTRRFKSKKHYFILVFLIIVCSSMQVRRYLVEIKDWKDSFGIRQQIIENAQILGGLIPYDKVVLSDRTQELRIVGNLHARELSREISLPVSEIRMAGVDGFLWGIIMWDPGKFLKRGEADSVRDILLRPETFPEFHRMQGWRQPLVLQYLKPPLASHR